MQQDVPTAVWADGKRKALIVCFGGNYEGLSWEKRLRALDVNFLHLQDTRYRWYLDGADGSAGVWDTVRKIKDYQARFPGLPLITLGQSSGGHAALRYGLKLGADLMLAFAPQTHFMIPRPLFEGQAPLYPPRDLFDVRPELNATDQQVVIVVGESEAENPPTQYFLDDLGHLQGVLARVNVKIIRWPTHTHTVAKEMARAGVLDQFVLEHVNAVMGRPLGMATVRNEALRRLRAITPRSGPRW
jgi:hypothetical protein